MPLTMTLAFGPLLKHLRKQAGMTQRDLAAALGYSESFISSLEKAHRQPDIQAVTERFIPALGLQADPQRAAELIEQAAFARGERPPASVTFQRTAQVQLEEEQAAHRRTLPALPTPLIGRTAEVHQLCNRLLGHSGRLLTLLGPPGIGKTTLALAVAARLQQHYPDGVVFVPLAAVNEPLLMLVTILAAVGSSDSGSKPPQTKLIEFLRRKTLLLVLDNLEQIGAAAPLIANLIAECVGLSILATSRERLHLRAEQRYKVAPLALAAAVELFTQRAQAIDSDFHCTPDSQPILEAICQRLDCLPLALELCAAQIDMLTPPHLLAQLQEHRLDLLVDGALDLPPHQRTLRRAIEYSERLLGDDERTLLHRLGVFVGGCDLPAVTAVAAAHPATFTKPLYAILHALLDKNLLRTETTAVGERRFLLLEMIREFAMEQLGGHAEEAPTCERHARYFLSIAEQSAQQMQDRDKKAGLDQIERELGNLRAAFHYLLGSDAAGALHLVVALREFWYLRDYYSEGRVWLAQALAQTATATSLHLLTLRGWALLAAAQLASHQGDRSEAEQWSAASIALFRQVADRVGLAEALREAGWIAHIYRTNQQAIQHFEESLLHFRHEKLAPRIADVLGALAKMYLYQAPDDKRVQLCLQECLALYRTLDDPNGMTHALFTWAEIEEVAGHYEEVAALTSEVYLLTLRLNNKQHMAHALSLRGEANVRLCHWESAQADLENAYQLFSQVGNAEGRMITLRNLGDLERQQGHSAAAGEHYQRCLQLCRELENDRLLACCLAGLGGVALLEGVPVRAATLLGAAQQRFAQFAPFLPPVAQAEVETMIADTRLQLGEALFLQAWAAGQSQPLGLVIG